MVQRVGASPRPLPELSPPPTEPAVKQRFVMGPRPSREAATAAGSAPGQRPPAPAAAGSTAPLQRLLGQVDQQRAEIDRAIAQARRGKTFSLTELLVLQDKVYAFSHNLEVFTQALDRTVGAIKTTLNTQL